MMQQDSLDDVIEDDQVYEDFKRKLKRTKRKITRLLDEFEISDSARASFNEEFKMRFGEYPSKYRQFYKKIKPYLKKLSMEMEVLRNNGKKLLTGILNIGYYSTFVIASNDKIEFYNLEHKIGLEQGISKPGVHKIFNGIYLGVYQLIDREHYDESPLPKTDWEIELFRLRLGKMAYTPFTESLEKCADLMIQAYMESNHNT